MADELIVRVAPGPFGLLRIWTAAVGPSRAAKPRPRRIDNRADDGGSGRSQIVMLAGLHSVSSSTPGRSRHPSVDARAEHIDCSAGIGVFGLLRDWRGHTRASAADSAVSAPPVATGVPDPALHGAMFAKARDATVPTSRLAATLSMQARRGWGIRSFPRRLNLE